METLSPPSVSLPASQDARATYDELSMQQSLLFSDVLKDLKNLRSQLYSAAEYFELSFGNDDQKQVVMTTLKDYAVKALVNTVDHLGSVSYKVNYLLDEKFDEVSGTDNRVSSMEQRIRACQDFFDLEGIRQQSLVITVPKYHKRYILPAGESLPGSGRHAVAYHQETKLPEDKGPHSLPAARQPTIKGRRPSFRKFFSTPPRRARSSSPSRKVRPPSPSPYPGNSLNPDKRASSPVPTSNLNLQRAGSPVPTSYLNQHGSRSRVPTSNLNPLLRSGSLSSRSAVLNTSNNVQQMPANTPKSASMRLHAERDEQEDADQTPSKGKRQLRAWLSRRKSKKDEKLYRYIDEY